MIGSECAGNIVRQSGGEARRRVNRIINDGESERRHERHENCDM